MQCDFPFETFLIECGTLILIWHSVVETKSKKKKMKKTSPSLHQKKNCQELLVRKLQEIRLVVTKPLKSNEYI